MTNAPTRPPSKFANPVAFHVLTKVTKEINPQPDVSHTFNLGSSCNCVRDFKLSSSDKQLGWCFIIAFIKHRQMQIFRGFPDLHAVMPQMPRSCKYNFAVERLDA